MSKRIDSIARRAKRVQRERSRRPILSSEEARNSTLFLRNWALNFNAKAKQFVVAPHAREARGRTIIVP